MPSLEHARLQKGSLVENTVKKNVLRMTHELKKSPVLHNLIKTNKIAIVGGYYNFQTGAVQLLTE